MIAAQKELSAKEVSEIAERYLEPHQSETYRLSIDKDRTRQDHDFWYVVVQPDRDDIRSYDIYTRLSEVEADIEAKEKVKVLLIPILPGD